jgi:hypothetical protein
MMITALLIISPVRTFKARATLMATVFRSVCRECEVTGESKQTMSKESREASMCFILISPERIVRVVFCD